MVEPNKFRQELFAIKGFLCPWGRAWPRCTSRWARPSRMDYFHCIHVTGQKRNLQLEDISFLPHVQAQPSSSSLLSPYITVALRHPAAWWHNISRQLRRRLRTRTDNAQVRHEEEGLTQEHGGRIMRARRRCLMSDSLSECTQRVEVAGANSETALIFSPPLHLLGVWGPGDMLFRRTFAPGFLLEWGTC